MIRTVRAAFALCLPVAAAGCVAETPVTGAIAPGTAVTGPSAPEAVAAQPARAIYSCGDQGSLTIESRSGSVLVASPEGDQVELPASPAAQQTRYGGEGYALVLEGQEALYMKAGRTPLTCRR